MDLPNLFSTSTQKDKLFLGAILTEYSVQAILWKVAKGDIAVIKTSEVLTFEKEEELIIKMDRALQELGELSENLSEIIFGFESSWVDQKGIADTKKIILKKLTTDLSLKPIGFVVVTEAIIQTLVKKEPHFNSLLLFYTKTKISVSLIEKGIVQKTESVGRSDDGVGDLVEALARFPQGKDKKLPHKIELIAIDINQDELYKQQQNLLAFDWIKKGYFSSLPIIKSLDQEIAITSVINQGGQAVAKAQGLEIKEPLTKIVQTNDPEFAFQEIKINNSNQITEESPDSNLKTPSNLRPATQKATQSSFGIPINSHQLPNPKNLKNNHDFAEQTPKFKIQNQIITKHKPNKTARWFKTHHTFALVGFFSGLVALLLIGFIKLVSGSTASLTLNLNPQNINKDVSIILNPKIAESDFTKLILKSELITKSVSSNQVNEVTGTTLVGEKAKGKIEIWNKTNGEKSFQAGTNFTANNLRFTLDEDVTIASSSTQEKNGAEVKTYGKTEAQLTAVAIGAESNLEKDTKLTVDSFSTDSYEANVLEPFSGGSSREIRVVSQEDHDLILTELKKKLLEIANSEFQADSKGEKTFVSTNVLTITQSNFSAKVGDEAKTLSLDLDAEVEAIVYQKTDLKPLAETVLKDLIPDGFQIVEKDPQILSSISEETASGSAITIDANLSTQAIPIIDLEALKKEIASQSLSSATAILTGKKEIKEFKIELFPKILETIWKKLPKNSNQIEIKNS